MLIFFSLLMALVFAVLIKISARLFGKKAELFIKGQWFLPVAVAPLVLMSLFLAKKMIEILGLS